MHLDVLASSPDEISRIEHALQEPFQELTDCRAQQTGEARTRLRAALRKSFRSRLFDIFAPFRTEYERGLECGSLWG